MPLRNHLFAKTTRISHYDAAVIQLRNVSVRYAATAVDRGGSTAAKAALSGVNLTISRGESIAVVGANGSGKSTLLRVLCGLVSIADGEITTETSLRFGFVGQDPAAQLLGATVEDDIVSALEWRGESYARMRARVESVLSTFSIGDIRDRPPLELSGGQQQRVALAGMFIDGECDVLALDEPTGHLDISNARAVQDAIGTVLALGTAAVLWVTHSADEIAQCDRLIGLQQGAVIFDGPSAQGLHDPDLIERLAIAETDSLELKRLLTTRGIPLADTCMSDEAIAAEILASIKVRH